MKTKISLSQLKGKINGNVVITVIMALLAVVLGYACYLTFDNGVDLEANVSNSIVEYNDNKNLLKNLKDLQANSNYYIAQKEKYDEVIAEAGTYNTVDYYVELSELCDKYGLTVAEITVGELVQTGSVQTATSKIAVVGDEISVKQMAEYIVSQDQIARIDEIAMTEQEDGTVIAAMTIVNFTK